MKKNKQPEIDNLVIDVVEYAFVEWLIRRNVFIAFKANYAHTPTATRTFRDCLRGHIRYAFRNPNLGPKSLISSAFTFASTPEGYDFWLKLSDDWARFYFNFRAEY